MCGSMILILTDGTGTNGKAREFEQLLLKTSRFARVQLRQQELRYVRRIAGVDTTIPYVLKTLAYILRLHIQGLTQGKGIEFAYLFRHGYKVIGRFVIHEELSVAVVYHPTRRIYRLLIESIAIGTSLIVRT